MKLIKNIFKICLAFTLLVCSVLPMNVFAVSEIDLDKEVLLTLDCKYQNEVLSDLTFKIYKVGSLNNKGEISLSNEFSKYPIDFNKKSQEEWDKEALTLKGYIQKDKISPNIIGKTDENGKYQRKMEQGLYLVIGDLKSTDKYVYKSSPFFVMLPSYEQSTGNWLYEVNSLPKITEEDNKKDYINKSVIKIWKDTGFEEKRPEEVEVELLADGKKYDSVVLNKKNNWRYTWEKLDYNKDWTVVENKLDKNSYTVSVSEEDNTFSVENTILEEDPIKKPDQKPLPQTGQLWWPIKMLISLGVIFMIFGFIREKRKKVN